ncbi:MAG TPA: hypothetical protein VHU23_17380 [Rhizomicrobium sp.]|nr:hypothetical protein [Rhizomicrobium sp.]
MSAGRREVMTAIGLGFRAERGGSVVIGVGVEGGAPRIVLSAFLATSAGSDRLSLEPYHVAVELARGARDGVPADAVAAVAEGRRRQDQLAKTGLEDILHKLEKAESKPVIAALLVNRAGWISDLLQYSLFAPEHPAVAEGLAVRAALRFALAQCSVETVEMDEKSLAETACRQLLISSTELEACLKRLGTSAGRPWRKEQKLACLSAWLAVAAP